MFYNIKFINTILAETRDVLRKRFDLERIQFPSFSKIMLVSLSRKSTAACLYAISLTKIHIARQRIFETPSVVENVLFTFLLSGLPCWNSRSTVGLIPCAVSLKHMNTLFLQLKIPLKIFALNSIH